MSNKTNYSKFLKQFKENQQKALEASEKIVNATVNEMFNRIVERTPVGDPSLWNYPAPKGYKPGTLKASWTMNGSAKGQGSLNFKLKKLSVSISNNQPYAERVEYGWSTQAPAGMMRITIKEYESILNQFALRHKL